MNRRISLLVAPIAALLAFAGCQAQMASWSGMKTVSPADFSVASENAAVDSTVDEVTSSPATSAAATEVELPEPLPQIIEPPPVTHTDAATTAPASAPAGPASSAAPQRVIVDSLIGQVNGRPIFADAFFEPIEDQILAARAQLSPSEFVSTMDQVISARLRQVIFNELVLAEAEADLTDDVRVGLRYWLKDLEEQKLAESLGVRARAEESLAAEGMTLDEYIRLRKDEAMVYTLVKQKIEPRVIVTWRDLEREYERRANEFNPPATVKLGKIVLNKEREQALIDEVETSLAEGKSLADIGAALSRPSAYSEDEYTLDADGLAGLPLRAEILDAISDLEVGETAQPVEVTLPALRPDQAAPVTLYWYAILSTTQNEARTLYDPAVQRQLYNELYARRLVEEQNRYLDSLLSKGIVDNIEEMSLRLRRIALLRYSRR